MIKGDMHSRSARRRARFVHALTAWALLSTVVGTLPAVATTRYTCVKGMSEAGPACPRCHGMDAMGGRATKTPCCRVVVDGAATATLPATLSTSSGHVTTAVALAPVVAPAGVMPTPSTSLADSPQPPPPLLAAATPHLRP